MKYLFVILAFLIASCGTTHKLNTQSSKSVDSVVTAIRDSAKVSQAQNYTDNFVAKGVDVTFDYGNDTDTSKQIKVADTVAWKPYYTNSKSPRDADPIAAIIKNAVANSGLAGCLTCHGDIKIHIDSLTNISSSVTTKNSVGTKAMVQTAVQTTTNTQTSKLDRTDLPWWIWVLGGLVALGGIVYLAFKFKII